MATALGEYEGEDFTLVVRIGVGHGLLAHLEFRSKLRDPVAHEQQFHSPRELASMLHREYVCIEIRNPLLALLGDSKVA
jgi:hypothetical protein